MNDLVSIIMLSRNGGRFAEQSVKLKKPYLFVSGIYMALQAMCCVLFIIWPNYYTFFMEIAVLVAMYLVFMKKYYRLHV